MEIRKQEISAEFSDKAAGVLDNIAKLTVQIKAETKKLGKTVKGSSPGEIREGPGTVDGIAINSQVLQWRIQKYCRSKNQTANRRFSIRKV